MYLIKNFALVKKTHLIIIIPDLALQISIKKICHSINNNFCKLPLAVIIKSTSYKMWN